MSVYLSDPSISMYVLHTVLYMLSVELLRRICVETGRRITYEILGVKGLKIHVSLHTHFSHFSLPLKGLEEYHATGKISFLLPSLVLFVEWSNTVY